MKRIIKASVFFIATVLFLLSTAFVSFAALRGDIDLNDKLTAADARYALRASVGLETLTEDLKTVADVNFDGKITAADARLILRASVGLENLGNTDEEHELVTVTVEPTCAKAGSKTVSCKKCSYKITEVLDILPHSMGEWSVILDSTADKEGFERAQCKNCGYYTDRTLPKKTAVYFITVDTGTAPVFKTGVAADGKYTLSVPDREGYNFKGWVDDKGNDFPSSGIIKADISVSAVWEIDGTNTLEKFIKRAGAGTDKIVITSNITVNQPIFIPYETTVYSDGDFSITRAPDYAGDIFVVGSDKNGKKSVDSQIKAKLTLGGGKGTLTVDGNRDNITVTVNGTAVFVGDSSELNIYDGVRIVNNLKTSNERINKYSSLFSADSLVRVGGAAVINISSVVNMYGGVIENNEVVTQYTDRDNGDGTVSQIEQNGCGGGVFNRGTFNMYGGRISKNEALRGGGIYNDKFCYLISGEISENTSHTYGGAVSSSSSSNADTFIGSSSEEKPMLIKNNHSVRAGGAVYSNTSSPIVIYKNAEFNGNRSDSSGGAVYTAGPLVVEGASFIDNSCEYSGGAIYHHYTKESFKRRYLELDGCYFEGNEGGLGGAVILSASGSILDEGTYAEFENCTFTKNNAVVTSTNPGNGGAVYITRNSDAIIKNCSFSENTAAKNAGALAIHSGATVDISDCSFNKNTANFGGAVYTSSESAVDMLNIEFNENSALMTEEGSGGNGGALYYAKATLTLSNVDFNNNQADNNAGAIYQNDATLKLDNTCDFIGNTAGNHGGALYLTYSTNEDGSKNGSVLQAENVTFKENSALAGGAISGRSASDITLNKVSFIGNSTPDAAVSTTTGGGAVYSNNSEIKITDCVLDGNSSGYYGGALRLDSCVTTLKNTQLLNNSGGTGGAVYASYETFDAENLTVKGNTSALNGVLYLGSVNASLKGITATENTAVNGGVLYAGRNSDIKLTDSDLISNTAKYGGVVYIAAKSLVQADNCEFTENTSENGQGGAVYVYGASFNAVNGSVFKKNMSSGHGGAVSAQDEVNETTLEKTYSSVNIEGCTFEENTGSSGGALYFNDSSYSLEDCSFIKNTATNETYGGGAVYNTGATGTISNVSFTENKALRGGAVAIYTNSVVEFSNITATGNEATADGGVIYANKCSVDLTKENIVLKDNKANNGGAVYATRAPLFDINGAVIEGNKASSNGGAVYASGSTVNISGENTVIRNNEAEGHGGAIYLSYVTESDSSKTGGVLNIDGASLTGNKALYGGAVSGRTDSVINLHNLTLSGNSTPDATSENKAGGGAIYTNNSQLILSDVIIDGNSSGYYGGAVYTEAAEVTLNNGSIVRGNNGGTGAAFYLTSGSSLEAEDITVENNRSTANGIFYLSGKTFSFSGVTAKNNTAGSGGGVIYTSGSAEVDITDCVFQGNTASNGGAVYHRSTKELTLNKTKFINNTASTNGGALDIVGSTVIAGGENEFTANTAAGHGGAVYVTYISAEGDTQARLGKFTVTDGIFEGNSAVGGGAVSIRTDCEAEFDGTIFKKNSVTGYEIKADGTGKPDGNAEGGGAIYVGYGKLTLNNVTALENEAYEGVAAEDNTVIKSFGGAVAAVKSQVSVTNGTYEGNKASNGGAFNIIDKSDVTFTGTVFQNNESVYVNKDYDNTVGGGAVNMNGGTLSLDKVTFTANKTGYYGGAVMASGTTVDIKNGTVVKNSTGATGAALHFKSKSDVTITDTEIINNTASANGVVYANNSTLTVSSLTASGNTAAKGGVFYVSNVNSVISVTESTFTGNSATSNGGVVYTENATVSFTDSVITENTAKNGGVAYSDGGKLNFTGGEIKENSATSNGGAIYGGTSEISLDGASFSFNQSGNHGGAVYAAGSSVTATGNNSFTENTAKNHGGAVYAVYLDIEEENESKSRIPTAMTMENGTFTGNTALGGGAVSIRSDCEAAFTGTSFINNSVSGFSSEADGDGEGGGAIYVGYGKLTLTDVTAENNIAVPSVEGTGEIKKSFGGAVDAVASTVTVTGGTYKNNKASVGGAFNGISKSAIDINGALIEGNESTYEKLDYDNSIGGGAVNIVGGSLTLEKVTLDGNKTGYYGGSVLASGTDVDILGGSIITNSNGATGAALLFKNKSDVTISDTQIINNTSSANGVVYANNSTVTVSSLTASGNTAAKGGVFYVSNVNSVVSVSDSTITGNSATSNGGVVYTENATVSFTDSVITENTAKNGGVAYSDGGKVNFTGCEITQNTATTGGAVYSLNGNADFTDGELTENTATTGGAVYSELGNLSFTGGKVAENSATTGGAVYATDTIFTIKETEFSENIASNNGGAIYARLSELSSEDAVFNSNSAKNHGGAIDAAGSSVTATGNNSFTENTAVNHGGAVYVVYLDVEDESGKTRFPGVMNMTGGSFTGNTALGGGAVSVRSNCEATFTGTAFTNNSVSGFSDKADGDGEGGGAIYVGYGKLTFNNVIANGNVANESVNAEDNSIINSFGGAIDSVSSTVTITDGSFDGNKATSGGAIHLFNKSVLTVDGTSFTNNESTGNTQSPVDNTVGGGAILSNKSTVTLSNAVLDGNKTNYYGGAVHGIASTVTINENSAVSNTSGTTGAALYFKDSCNVTLKDITVSGNTSSSNGVIYTNSGTLTAENVTANKNRAANGGVLYVSGGSAKAYIIGGVWSENNANTGGALFVNSSVVETDGVIFSDNTSTLGGAVYITKGEVTADNTEFTNNHSAKNSEDKNGNGGAVYIGAGTFKSSENIKFSNNTAEAHGGAVYVSYATNTDETKIPGILNITGGIFENNSASIGGAISARTSCITTLNGTVLKDNTATDAEGSGGGGAIYANDNTVTLSGITATGNSTGFYGGVMTGVNANVTVDNNSSFSSNLGKTGPVFNFRGTSKVTINGISVTDNKVSNGNGIIYMTSSGTLDVTGLTATGNNNANGGVFYISSSASLTIKDSVLSGNSASGFGGAIDFRSSGTLSVTDTEISGNSAKNGGAMNLAGSGPVEISGCTFSNNTASASGGALYVTGSGLVTVSDNNSFKENTAPTAGAIHLDAGAKATVSNSSFEGNTATGGDGGAIIVSDSTEEGTAATTLTLNGVTFTQNTASSKGGAVSTDTASPNLVINAVNCIFDNNSSIGAGGGAVEIQNGNCTSANGPTENKLVFTNCKFTQNTSKTTGAAVEIRTSSCAKFDGIEATGNCAGSGKQNGGVFYVTSNHSRLYLTGTVTQSGNAAASTGKFAYLYNSNYSNPPRIYTSHSNTAPWISDVGGNKASITFDLTTMP